MSRRPPRSTRTDTRVPTRRSADLQAEDLRQAEVDTVIAEIKEKMEKYGLTLADLGAAKSSGKAKKSARSEEHTSELQSLMRNSYAVFCLNNNRGKSTENTNKQMHSHTTTSNHRPHYTTNKT